MKFFVRMALAVCSVASCFASARAATILFVESAESDGITLAQAQAAAQFYGLDMVALRANASPRSFQIHLRDPETVAVVVDAGALASLDREVFEGGGRHLPLLIAGIESGDDPRQLEEWSAGGVLAGLQFDAGRGAVSNVVGDLPAMTRQLTGITWRLPARTGFALKVGSQSREILSVTVNTRTYPVFISAGEPGREIYFAAKGPRLEVPRTSDPYRQQTVFATIAPFMMLFRYAAGDQAWHTPGNFANLTIDDVWLREPYGNVVYTGLLREMTQHRFHTTMAFIPWNYDRSEPAMVSLFVAHPDFFSICIHGNNHVHQEFGPLSDHPLSKQTTDLRQAVARMERFHSLTGISYDRVMVFPHSVAPTETLAELKRANYLATANSLNVPSDADPTVLTDVALRTTTLAFADFPSMRRYSAENEIPEAQLAIDAFLGNPILVYVHEAFFASGMNRFDPVADTINRLDSGVEWSSLGNIAAHDYLERKRGEEIDVRLLTATAKIENKSDREVLYSIEKAENFATPLTVRVDGIVFPYKRESGYLHLRLPVRPSQTRVVTIEYGDPLDTAAIDISKKSLSVAAVRRLSDFRDNELSKSASGRRFIRSYTDNSSRWNHGIVAGIALLLLTFLAIQVRRRARGAVSPQQAQAVESCTGGCYHPESS